MVIQLKAKHYFLIVNQLKRYSIEQYLPLMLLLKSQLQNNTDGEELISITVTADNVIDIYARMGEGKENLFTGINAEMKNLLLPQVMNGVSAGDEEWLQVADYIQTLDANNATIINNLIEDGRTFLQSA